MRRQRPPWCGPSCRARPWWLPPCRRMAVGYRARPAGTTTASSRANDWPAVGLSPAVRPGPTARAAESTTLPLSAVLGEMDVWLLAEGSHLRPYEVLGAAAAHAGRRRRHRPSRSGRRTRRASVVGDLTTGTAAPPDAAALRAAYGRSSCPAWPGRATSSRLSRRRLAAAARPTPARQAELRPATASVVADAARGAGLAAACECQRGAPASIYEVHLASWRRQARAGKQPLADWDELAATLVPYARRWASRTWSCCCGVSEHPFDGSWGYQPLCTRRRRASATGGLLRFVEAHDHGLGVLLDWVPAHFPPTRTAWRASTARTCTSTPIRARASTGLETR